MEGQTQLITKLLRINQLETRLKNLKDEVKKQAPALAQELIDKYGEGTINVLGHKVEVKVKTGRPSLAWRKYLDWLSPNLTPSQKAKESEFMSTPESKPSITVLKKLK